MLYGLAGVFPVPKIEVFVRHCYYSEVSAHKGRYPYFSHKKCHENLMATIDLQLANITFFLDTYHKDKQKEEHFIVKEKKGQLISIAAGTETGSFLALLDYVLAQPFDDETIIYFLEDDYLHKPNWTPLLFESLSLPGVDYSTLFDHADKYAEVKNCTLYHSSSCHWRSTVSTTNTYAMRLKTLKKDHKIHKEYSLGRRISADHEKFCRLREEGRQLVSAVPGWSTHVDPPHVSPCFDWESLLESGV